MDSRTNKLVDQGLYSKIKLFISNSVIIYSKIYTGKQNNITRNKTPQRQNVLLWGVGSYICYIHKIFIKFKIKCIFILKY